MNANKLLGSLGLCYIAMDAIEKVLIHKFKILIT